ncbi:MAG TPA: sugar O-acetyltransferase [Chitinophagaceae bacterium]|nr:sugar O-acetyltransferase [Chitinophagaceae bacterium]
MKTVKEKMMSGELYDAYVPELVAERDRAKEQMHIHNHLLPSQLAERGKIIKAVLGTVGKKFLIEQPFFVEYGYNIHLGENFFSNFNCVILDEAPVRFGDDVLLAPNVSIYTVNHAFNHARRKAALEYARPVTIGNNVWIGGNTVILPGVTIGDNTVIGAGSVVTKNIPSGVLAAGNPCKVIRVIGDDEI